jgi:hypothetical protein
MAHIPVICQPHEIAICLSHSKCHMTLIYLCLLGFRVLRPTKRYTRKIPTVCVLPVRRRRRRREPNTTQNRRKLQRERVRFSRAPST